MILSFLLALFISFLNLSNCNFTNNLNNLNASNNNLDIFQQEISYLEETIDLYRKKIEVLKKIREAYIFHNKTLMPASEINVVPEKIKYDSRASYDFRNEYLANEAKATKKGAEVLFMNRVFMKFNIPVYKNNNIKYLNIYDFYTIYKITLR